MIVSSETQIKLNLFKPRPYQIPILDALENKGYKRVIAIWPRRAGKDLVAFNYMIRCAIRTVGVFFYIFPTYSQARKVIYDSITSSGKRFVDFIPPELLEKTNSTELKYTFINGSIIQLIGSDNIDAIVGTNPLGCVFSEYALQDPKAYQFLRPALTHNDGWALFISCVSPNTLVIGEEGIRRINTLSDSRNEYTEYNKNIFGLSGFHKAEDFYYGGKQKTLKITLSSGYQIECTPVHQIWNGNKWIKASELIIGNNIPVQYGQNIWGKGFSFEGFYRKEHASDGWTLDDRGEDKDFFYLLGLIHADGCYDYNKITVTKKKDQQIIDFLLSNWFNTRKDGIHHVLNSRIFISFLEWAGFKHGARNKTFPGKLFECTRDQMKYFLQGLFDGDGTSNKDPRHFGYIKLTTTCLEFLRDLQVVLLNFGIVSSMTTEEKAPTKKVKVWSTIYNIEIRGYFAHVFYQEIGFRLDRKQKNREHLPDKVKGESGNIYPVDVTKLNGYSLPKCTITNPSRISRRLIRELNLKKPNQYLQELLKEKFFYSPIKKIEESYSEVFDFVIPETHSFFSNGFISHNTPRGHNAFYELYQIALHNKNDFYVSKLTCEDTQHISLKEIEREVAQGELSRDMANQEYFTSFDMGVSGSYYSKYLDRMRVNGQIGIVPYETGFPVHTSWDIGHDATSIIFFQTVGQIVRIIDAYENSSQGLEHYIKVINQKPWAGMYGKMIGPHDLRCREWASSQGQTRLEKAKQLGVNFTIANNLPIEDGIEMVRSTLSKTWIDEKNCADLIKSLENYRREFNEKLQTYKEIPVHDKWSHFCDSMRYLAISLPKTRIGLSAEELDARYREAVYGDKNNLPAVFRDDLPNY